MLRVGKHCGTRGQALVPLAFLSKVVAHSWQSSDASVAAGWAKWRAK